MNPDRRGWRHGHRMLHISFLQYLRFSAFICGSLLCCAAIADPHTFRFDPPPELEPVSSVTLAGTFNGWSRDATPMADADGDGVYEATLDLPDGVHHYKFVVNGDRWLNDPASDRELEESDGHGGMNSAVLIGPDARKLAPPKPGRVNPRGVLHKPDDPAHFSVAEGLVRVGVDAQAGDVDTANVRWTVFEDGRAAGNGVMTLARVDERLGYDRFTGQLALTGDRLIYGFELVDGLARVNVGGPDEFEVDLDPTLDTPTWARHAVWYQLFPERFRDGDPRNNPPTAPRWTAEWYDTHPEIGEKPGDDNFYHGHGNVWRRRYGGDLQGVIQALPYLKRLGVNAIYFNPLFEAPSLHKYDATDHRHIDDNFGIVEADAARSGPSSLRSSEPALGGETDDPATWRWTPTDLLFLDFVEEAHRQGFRVILDGVWNHVGVEHFAFQDVLRHGRSSRYADWFEITDWGSPQNWGHEPWWEVHGKPGGIQWKAWDRANGDLPTFRKDPTLGLAPGPREHVMAVTRRWMRPIVDGVPRPQAGIDGWRLDVPHDIPMPFWRDWRGLVKGLNPEALIIGEVWGPADAWVQGDAFDGVMNYQFAMAAVDFFADERTAITPTQFLDRLVDLYLRYPLPAALVMQNLIDSHDTDRVASMMANPDRNYDQNNRLQDGHGYDASKPDADDWARLRLAAAAQFTFPGCPMIYYGTEAGMWGPDDPNNRMPMVWPDLEPYEDPAISFNDDLFAWYQRLAALRLTLPELSAGGLRPVLADDERRVAAYARDLGGRAVYVVLNRSSAEQTVRVPVDAGATADRFVNWLDPAQAEVALGPDGRPAVALVAAPLPAEDGRVTITLPAYGAAVLSAAPAE